MEEVKNYYAGRHLISMEEGTLLICRKAPHLYGGRQGRQGKAGEGRGRQYIRLIMLTYYYLGVNKTQGIR